MRARIEICGRIETVDLEGSMLGEAIARVESRGDLLLAPAFGVDYCAPFVLIEDDPA